MFEKICNELNLGKVIELNNVLGGITNQMYKVITTKGTYAVKIINKNRFKDSINLLDEIENSEVIANIASKNGVNAVCALEFNGRYIQQIDNYYFLIYDWIPGKIKLTKEINLENVRAVAYQQALLHQINVNDFNFNNKIEKYKFNDYEKYYDLLKNRNEQYLAVFKQKYEEFIKMYKNIYDNYLKLNEKLVFAHRDLNRKNIIWNNEVPYIIDWETAKLSYPSIDFFNSIWFLSNDVEENKFYEYAKTYLSNNDINIENGVYAGIIEECNWLYFSLSRLFSNDPNEVQLGITSIESSLKEIFNYYNNIPLMLKLLKSITKNH